MNSYFQFYTSAYASKTRRKKMRQLAAWPESKRATELIYSFQKLDLSVPEINNRLNSMLKSIGLHQKRSLAEALTKAYPLNRNEGLLLLRLAEALPRMPNDETALLLFKEAIRKGNWQNTDRNQWTSFLLSTLKFLLTHWPSLILPSFLTDAVLKTFLRIVTKLLVNIFVLAPDIESSREKLLGLVAKGIPISLDLLGEDALGSRDGIRHWENCHKVIELLGMIKASFPQSDPEISVKLSALDSKYELPYGRISFERIYSKLKSLCLSAFEKDISLCIDAEQYFRLEFTLDLLESLLSDRDLEGYNKLGFVVQSYLKNSESLIDYLGELCKEKKRKLSIRLVKGAYWDHEIIRSQSLGLGYYPVYTLKELTELSYMACVNKLYEQRELLSTRIATHNPATIAAVLEFYISRKENRIEFQRLYGLGEAVENWLKGQGFPTRVYIPIGTGKELFGYLARRLIENGAGLDAFVAPFDFDKLYWDLLQKLQKRGHLENTKIPLPPLLYRDRENAPGCDLSNPEVWEELGRREPPFLSPLQLFSHNATTSRLRVLSPANSKEVVGEVPLPSDAEIEKVLSHTASFALEWDRLPVEQRVEMVRRLAKEIWEYKHDFLYLLCAEAGKTIPNALAEIREAIDFCYYYSKEALRLFSKPILLPGPMGEENKLHYHGRGLWVCISPWNFPLSIFLGQLVAALLTGNVVVAKPAEETPLIALLATELAYKAGIPKEALSVVAGNGQIGQKLILHPSVRGVAFTGSFETAKQIARCLSQKEGPIVPLIAETGGINGMVVDATAAIERAVKDIIYSAFNHAGQRCSSLRVLLVQKEISKQLLSLLSDALEDMFVGDPRYSETDVGPIISPSQLETLNQFSHFFRSHGHLLTQAPIGKTASAYGYYFAPQLFEIPSLDLIDREIFGPILPVLSFSKEELRSLLQKLYQKGYGLTMGLQTRLDSEIERLSSEAPVGNFYVNRSMIGATVESQPFGGEGLSGTGPKAGGPNYLLRFVHERLTTINTAALGDPSLYFLDGS
ncbi:proline dehydrogenase [Methylacidiphilum sp. Yel]|uniref:bifunctional proline dehydrogenase/L-glutamate gamma-semialdehyde dehydrogenase PutA n=1 Tax=Methylacidiphilum sp. Yel TaxID=1847730 RepID=UPI00106D5CDC|nr:bifunctional proline dehydrogenase/L-glutamate gamma-semialdehyde dehydrogenase PutA [Methylacidiphilum sp. Yel]TFE67901.1 proline dehydrogenase [Methylacidiphilum sp. Yel]